MSEFEPYITILEMLLGNVLFYFPDGTNESDFVGYVVGTLRTSNTCLTREINGLIVDAAKQIAKKRGYIL